MLPRPRCLAALLIAVCLLSAAVALPVDLEPVERQVPVFGEETPTPAPALAQPPVANGTTGSPPPGTTAGATLMTLWQMVSASAGRADDDRSDFDLLTRALGATSLSGLVFETSTNGITLLAPTDAAFVATANELGYGGSDEAGAYSAIERVLDSASGGDPASLLLSLVSYHIIAGGMNAQLFASYGNVRTYNFATVALASNMTLVPVGQGMRAPRITGSRVAENGFLHTIDRVLFPFNVDRAAAASVIASAAAGSGGGGGSVCFPGDARVLGADGRSRAMAEVAAGDLLAAPGGEAPSPVFLFTHRVPGGLRKFVRIAAGGHAIALSAAHYVYANGVPTRADAVRVGDVMRTVSGARRADAVGAVWARGLVAPHTLHGDIVVGGIVASTYTALFPPQVAHALLAPVRALVAAGVAEEPLGAAFYNGMPRPDVIGWARAAALRVAPALMLLQARSG